MQLVPLAEPRLQPVFLHQAHDPFAAHVLVLLEQILVDARAAVAMLALLERRPHQHFQSAIVARMRRFRTTLPGVEATAGDAQTPTENRDGVLGLLRGDEPKSYRLCFAKKAVAFFRMSRSSCRMRFSLRSRASSSRSAVVSPVLPLRAIGPRLAHPLPPATTASDPARARPRRPSCPSSKTSRTAAGRELLVNCRRARRPVLLDPIVDIVSAFRKVSTKPDQAHTAT